MRNYSTRSWYCNKANRKIFGVCSGLADYYNSSVTVVRIVALLMLITFPGLTLFAYIAAGLILPARYGV